MAWIVCEKVFPSAILPMARQDCSPLCCSQGRLPVYLPRNASKDIQPRDASVREVQDSLLKHKAYIMPFVDIKPGDPAWEAVQRVGVMGIIKGFGKSIDWENKTFFYPDSTLSMGELKASLENVFGSPFKTGKTMTPL